MAGNLPAHKVMFASMDYEKKMSQEEPSGGFLVGGASLGEASFWWCERSCEPLMAFAMRSWEHVKYWEDLPTNPTWLVSLMS